AIILINAAPSSPTIDLFPIRADLQRPAYGVHKGVPIRQLTRTCDADFRVRGRFPVPEHLVLPAPHREPFHLADKTPAARKALSRAVRGQLRPLPARLSVAPAQPYPPGVRVAFVAVPDKKEAREAGARDQFRDVEF